MRKLLIVDTADVFLDALTAALKGMYEIHICHDPDQALERMPTLRPDCLILDLMLPGMDGICFLQAVFTAGLHPVVLPLSRYYSDYITYALHNMGIPYLMTKPCSPRAVAARLVDIETQITEKSDPEQSIHSTLLLLGLRTDLSGYTCICNALQLLMRDPEQSFTKCLYPEVAHICGGTAVRVERAIRSAIQDAWSKRDDRLWRLYFPPDALGRHRCPCNSVFLARIAACLQQKPAARAI